MGTVSMENESYTSAHFLKSELDRYQYWGGFMKNMRKILGDNMGKGQPTPMLSWENFGNMLKSLCKIDQLISCV